ncbi:HlyD family type I secretion periplasmic adaptor subunit [Rhizobium sp.]|uniref:HlyD family type I secretion periplasmic adaptor subunit n=1 Tax=Rhizobium sp. TaxID=391 RepID=UPI0028AB8630
MTSTPPPMVRASPTVRVTAWLLLTLFAVILAGSIVAKTEVVARGSGKLVPISRVQIVQPLADGKIIELNVNEGQTVAKGDVLLKLDPTAAESDIQRIQANIEQQSLDANVADAIIAPLASTDPTGAGFVELGIQKFRQDWPVNSEKEPEGEALVRAALVALRDQVLQTDARLKQLELQQQAQNARIEKARIDRDIVSQKLSSAENLMKQGVMSRNEHLDRLRELRSIDGDAQVAASELSALAASTEATRRQRAAAISDNLATQRRRLREAEIARDSSDAALRAAQDRLNNLTLRSPAGGRIENMAVHTIGGFVEAGATLMGVVPTEGDIEVEAFFGNRDVGFLQTGQAAYAKFDAFPSERFGVVPARVTNIGADAREDGSAQWVYAVRLQLEKSVMQVDGKDIPFSPGMTVTVDIVTSQRRLISYFFEPITRAFQNGLKER